MEIYILFLFLALVAFTYCLYLLGREDVVFIRKNITLEQLFNLFFVTLIFSFLIARLLYVLINPSWVYLNPIEFFNLSSRPGMSIIGGVIAASVFIFYYSRLKKLPLGRIFDFFALSFFAALPFGVIGTFFISSSLKFTESIFLPVLYLFLFVFLLKIIFPKLLQGSLKSGSIGLFVILLFSLIWFLTSMVRNRVGIWGFITIEDLMAILVFTVSLFILIKHEERSR